MTTRHYDSQLSFSDGVEGGCVNFPRRPTRGEKHGLPNFNVECPREACQDLKRQGE